jgi:hypothetical protein
MTAKTRYFLLGSVLVLTVGLSIGLVAFYGGMPTGLFGAQQGPAELKYIPADATVVAYANVKDVMASELRQRLRRFEGMTDEGRSEFKDQTGIDIENDIDHVVACVGAKLDAAESNGMVLASGRFDAGRIEALAIEHGGKVEQYKGKRLITAIPDAQHEGRSHGPGGMTMVFLAPGLVALGGTDMVRLAVDRGNGAGSVLGNAEMMKLVADMGNPSLWAVGRFDALSAQASLPAEVTDRIPPITWFAASGRVNGGLQATLKAEAKDEQGANNLRDIVRGFAALARMQAGNKPGAQSMMPDFQLAGEGKEVSLSFAVTTDMLDAFATAGAISGKMKKSIQPGETK